MTEQWKDIKGFEGRYAVSNFGRVKSLSRKTSGPRGEQTIREKLLKPVKSNYLNVSLWKNGLVKVAKIHRLVASAFVENPSERPEVNHIDGDRFNNSASNLEWATRKENVDHAIQNNLAPLGERHKNHKLTTEQVLDIRSTVGQGQKTLAKRYGCSQATISNIKAGKSRRYE